MIIHSQNINGKTYIGDLNVDYMCAIIGQQESQGIQIIDENNLVSNKYLYCLDIKIEGMSGGEIINGNIFSFDRMKAIQKLYPMSKQHIFQSIKKLRKQQDKIDIEILELEEQIDGAVDVEY